MKTRYQLLFSGYGGFGKARWYLLMMVITSLSGWLAGQQLALDYDIRPPWLVRT
ncbi:hypothetical protein N644_1716 [Lactiplantibacillus paraplantarum]|uniref:Uncharacterized protein n=2 Tax=Lactiplantibacillus paraplantarum TaxID=60520 RepID=A0ABQ0N6S6_9LACO|nr:hypothetical protein N644_1716 [Lactiplantibacillus paraplantarum]KRL51647.1 hypothetical protein FD48_GL000347 [Lactiplantibacillus paraplantarum DSM 10667]QJU49503.1 hypothetical protein CK401_00313 [Lactiplantibacillus paraplantarum]GBF00748.1 hypothetical protein LPPLD21_00250 [Lactiplantibacillus paraplantarum]